MTHSAETLLPQAHTVRKTSWSYHETLVKSLQLSEPCFLDPPRHLWKVKVGRFLFLLYPLSFCVRAAGLGLSKPDLDTSKAGKAGLVKIPAEK